MKKEYLTVEKEVDIEIEERKSRFIASVKSVETEPEALEFLDHVKNKYKDASHYCYAYFVNKDVFIQRFNDAGEPSGTAGMPILEVIKRNEIQNVMIVVTRYFGGVLLGAGGLVRAYGKAASEGVAAAGKIKRVYMKEVIVTASYHLLGKLQNAFANKGYRVKEIRYTENVAITVIVPLDEVENLVAFCEETAGKNIAFEMGREYFS